MNVSITHELDLDGLGSQAIIQRYYTHSLEENKSELILHYSHYTNFIDKIKIILEAKILPERLIISDMGFNDDFKKVYSLFKKSREIGCEIFWFDHHIIDINHENELKKTIDLYINDPDRCAAEIVKDYYLPEDSIAIKIAKFSRDIDFHTKKYKISSNLQSIISYNRGYELDDVKKKIIELMSRGIFENDWYTEQLRIVKKWEEEQSAFALKHTQLIKIEDFGKLAISFGKIGGGILSSFLKENYPEAKIFIGIDSRYNEITLRSNYVNCREIARFFKGGGHKDRAGFRYKNIFVKENKIDQTFIRSIKEKILKYRI